MILASTMVSIPSRELALLQNTEELGRFQADGSDLIEEDGAMIGPSGRPFFEEERS
jgi:hypothetical protein